MLFTCSPVQNHLKSLGIFQSKVHMLTHMKGFVLSYPSNPSNFQLTQSSENGWSLWTKFLSYRKEK